MLEKQTHAPERKRKVAAHVGCLSGVHLGDRVFGDPVFCTDFLWLLNFGCDARLLTKKGKAHRSAKGKAKAARENKGLSTLPLVSKITERDLLYQMFAKNVKYV